MTTLTDAEKIKIRNALERKARELGIPVRWTKPHIHNVLQAIEDVFDSPTFKTAVSNAIDNASPLSFSATEKTWIAAQVFEAKFLRDQ
jgi:hypothetical protein